VLKTSENSAVIIGATGLVGHALLRLLLSDHRFSKVVALGRRSLMIDDSKLTEYVVDFDQPEKWVDLVQGDVAFSALGTTLRVAGSKDAQMKVDFTYQLKFAEAAKKNGIPTFVLVSAAGANSGSSNFYSKMKGQLDDAVAQLGFSKTCIIRPGFLKGLRKEFRLGEVLAQPVLEVLKFVPGLKKFRPIDCWIVAKAMIQAANGHPDRPLEIFTLEEVFAIASK
jgi:uncharacterized protein YbjT (DUF2867 family)